MGMETSPSLGDSCYIDILCEGGEGRRNKTTTSHAISGS
jgi:hypothetical protein